MLIIWFGLGYLAYEYSLRTVVDWIIFCFGAVGLYYLISRQY